MQPASQDIFRLKYALDGEETPSDSFVRVAKALAANEKDPSYATATFLNAMQQGAIPAGRIISNAGATHIKSGTSTINCTVSSTIGDSMEGIMAAATEAAITLSTGAGIGYEFSTLRPRGAYVSGAGAYTSGPLSFMDIFDAMCFTVSSAGGRRGAQMATFDVHHPDIEAFIEAKQQDRRFRQFNCSVLATNEFMDAVKNNREWVLSFPIRENEPHSWDLPNNTTWRNFPKTPEESNYTRRADGKVLCRIYKTLPARELWDKIMRSTYDYAEPGILFVDTANLENPLYWCETLRTTNPCAEQWLPPYGACLLGSLNLTKFVIHPFSPHASFDHDGLCHTIKSFAHMLDNVVEINNLPLERQRQEISYKRRHGMGITGLGSALTMLGLRYGSPQAVSLTKNICKNIALTDFETGIDLAIARGPAPIYHSENNRELSAKSTYLQRLFSKASAEVQDNFLQYGSRWTHGTSIAPTGTISLALCNNVSNGIEPTFAHHYKRNVIKESKATKDQQDVYSYESLLWNKHNPGTPLPDYAITTNDINPHDHLLMQAAAQPWVDSSISKTINVPTNIPFDDFKNIYMEAWERGLKGCTTYRYNPEGVGAVLTRPDELADSTFLFTLKDGSTISARGDEQIDYDGQTHIAANLYEAIKEGNYGRF